MEVRDFRKVSVSRRWNEKKKMAEKPQGRQNLLQIQRTDKCRVNKEEAIQTDISFAKLRLGAIIWLA